MRATQFTVTSVLAGLEGCFVAVVPVAAQQSAPQPLRGDEAMSPIGDSLPKPNYATYVMLCPDPPL